MVTLNLICLPNIHAYTKRLTIHAVHQKTDHPGLLQKLKFQFAHPVVVPKQQMCQSAPLCSTLVSLPMCGAYSSCSVWSLTLLGAHITLHMKWWYWLVTLHIKCRYNITLQNDRTYQWLCFLPLVGTRCWSPTWVNCCSSRARCFSFLLLLPSSILHQINFQDIFY